MAVEAGDLYLDYSKNRLTGETVRLLVALAERAGLRAKIDDMFAGRRINVTEDRPVLHVALRMPPDRSIVVDGQDAVAEVHAVLARMLGVAARLRAGGGCGDAPRRPAPWRGPRGPRRPRPGRRPRSSGRAASAGRRAAPAGPR